MTNIIVDSIRLRNFGAVKDATLRPLHEGLTGIAGVSGAGKSTFLKAMRFALFNDVPKGVKIANLRRIGTDPKKDECSVSVVFFHGGQKIEVIRELIGKNSQNIPSVYVDGVEQVHTSSSTAEAWVKKRLGMDAKDFTTATVIPQKQLDELVDDTPAIRRGRIEKLAGIEAMSAAVKNAREEENAVKAQANAMPGSPDTLHILLEEVESFEVMLTTDRQEMSSLESYVSGIENEYKDAEKDYQELTEKFQSWRTLNNRVNALEEKIVSLKHNRKVLQNQLESVQDGFEDANDVDVEAIEHEIIELDAQISALGSKVNKFNMTVNSLNQSIAFEQDNLSNKKKQLESGKELILTLKANLIPVDDSLIVSAEEKVNTVQANISDANARRSQLVAEWKESSESVKLLKETVHDAQCPTCHSHLKDPSALISALEKGMVRIENEGNALKGSLVSLESELKDSRNHVQSLHTAKQEYLNQQSKITDTANAVNSLQSDIEVIEKTIAKKNADLEDAYLFDADTIQDSLSDASQSKNALLRRLEAAKHTENARKQMEALESNISALNDEIEVLEEQYCETKILLGNTENIDEEDMLNAKNLLISTQTVITERKEKLNELKMAVSTNAVRLENAKKEYDKEKGLIASKAKLLAELEHKSAVSDVLDEFRKSSIAKIAPELSDSATELISAMTNGKFIEISLDSEFTPSVTNSEGHILTIHQLSGGELSVVALALRIAIGSLISGGTGGMLWLDEVLSAQDMERRHAILNAIRSLPVNQIVMINHTQEAEDVVDKVVRMQYSADDGSFIQE